MLSTPDARLAADLQLFEQYSFFLPPSFFSVNTAPQCAHFPVFSNTFARISEM